MPELGDGARRARPERVECADVDRVVRVDAERVVRADEERGVGGDGECVRLVEPAFRLGREDTERRGWLEREDVEFL